MRDKHMILHLENENNVIGKSVDGVRGKYFVEAKKNIKQLIHNVKLTVQHLTEK